MSQWSAGEIHLPQLLNEEAIADEFSNWEQVSSLAAERFPHLTPRPPGPAAVTSPGYQVRVVESEGVRRLVIKCGWLRVKRRENVKKV